MSDYVRQRGSVFYYYRRVPKRFSEVEDKREVSISLQTDSYELAARKAKMINEQIIMRWEAMKKLEAEEAATRWDAALELARSFDVRYQPAGVLVNGDVADLLQRLEILEGVARVSDRPTSEALMGVIEVPTLSISKALEVYWDYTKDLVQTKSPNQVRKWQNPIKKAFKNFIDLKGDIAIEKLTRDEALDFRDWWMDRIVEDGLTANSANKDIGNLNKVLSLVCEYKRIPYSKPFEGLKFKETAATKTPPFSNEFVRSHFLAKRGLEGLDDDQELVFYILMETGARPGEIINLKPENIILSGPVPHIRIRQSDDRQIKTKNANRDIPLVGIALWVMKQRPQGFPALHDREDSVSGNINKFLRNNQLKESEAHTVYSLRASFQDRMLEANHPELGQIPERVQADLMGHSTDRPKYGQGAKLGHLAKWLEVMAHEVQDWV